MTTVVVLAIALSALVWLRPRATRRLTTPTSIAPSRRVRRRRKHAAESMTALAAFSSEIRVGTPPRTALRLALQPTPWLCPATFAALRDGTDITSALRHDSRQQRLPEWDALATVWALSDERGVSIRPAADQLLNYVKQVVATRHLLAAELAQATSTIRVLALLPLAGLFLGTLLGANPLGWLVGSSIGRVVLVLALACEGVGWLWVRAIARRVARRL